MAQKKVVYLFGAGATHAEKMVACPDLKKSEETEWGLLNKNVAKRVIRQRAILNVVAKYNLDKEKWDNFELLISLLEQNKSRASREGAQKLRKYYRQEILTKLRDGRNTIKPKLYSALLELQDELRKKERVLGYLTLNYDSLFDIALHNHPINYGFSIENSVKQGSKISNSAAASYYLKVHGSFDWFLNEETGMLRRGDVGDHRELQWIPPGLIKGYADYPYNLLFGRTREILVECDILRIVGCSLSQNDFALLSLLFETQTSGTKKKSYVIEVIDSDEVWKGLRDKFGSMLNFEENSFYGRSTGPHVTRGGAIVEICQVNGVEIPQTNPFLEWLFYKLNIESIAKRRLKNTIYLKSLKKWIRHEES